MSSENAVPFVSRGTLKRTDSLLVPEPNPQRACSNQSLNRLGCPRLPLLPHLRQLLRYIERRLRIFLVCFACQYIYKAYRSIPISPSCRFWHVSHFPLSSQVL